MKTRLRAGASTGATGLCVIEQWCEPGTGAPTHTHFEVEEVIAVLEGAAEFRIDAERRRVEAGATIVLPPWSRHGFTNVGEGVLHTMAIFAAAAPPVEYEDEAGIVYEIGGTGEERRDAHRAVRKPRQRS